MQMPAKIINQTNNMEGEINNGLDIIQVVMHADGKSAVSIGFSDRDKKYRIQEIMLGAGPMRKSIPWTDKFIKEHTECRAEILENGKLRII